MAVQKTARTTTEITADGVRVDAGTKGVNGA